MSQYSQWLIIYEYTYSLKFRRTPHAILVSIKWNIIRDIYIFPLIPFPAWLAVESNAMAGKRGPKQNWIIDIIKSPQMPKKRVSYCHSTMVAPNWSDERQPIHSNTSKQSNSLLRNHGTAIRLNGDEVYCLGPVTYFNTSPPKQNCRNAQQCSYIYILEWKHVNFKYSLRYFHNLWWKISQHSYRKWLDAKQVIINKLHQSIPCSSMHIWIKIPATYSVIRQFIRLPTVCLNP